MRKEFPYSTIFFSFQSAIRCQLTKVEMVLNGRRMKEGGYLQGESLIVLSMPRLPVLTYLSIFSLFIPHPLPNFPASLSLSRPLFIELPCLADSSITIAVCSKYSHSWQPALAWQPCFPLSFIPFYLFFSPSSSFIPFRFSISMCLFLCNLFS